jgi:hypothetical protein
MLIGNLVHVFRSMGLIRPRLDRHYGTIDNDGLHDPVRAIRFVCPKLSNTGCPLRCERVGAWAIKPVISSGSRLSSQNLRQSVAPCGCPPNQAVPLGELGGEPLGIVVAPSRNTKAKLPWPPARTLKVGKPGWRPRSASTVGSAALSVAILLKNTRAIQVAWIHAHHLAN